MLLIIITSDSARLSRYQLYRLMLPVDLPPRPVVRVVRKMSSHSDTSLGPNTRTVGAVGALGTCSGTE